MAGSANEPMDQQTAQFLFREGGTLVFLDVPPGTEFGIDYNSWYVGPKFKGVKMIPPGIHFVYYSAVSRGQSAPRTGFFHNFTKRQVVLKRWDPATEAIHVEVVSTEDQESTEKNKRDMDRFLGPYPYDSYRMWVSLTHHVTPGLLSRLHPLCGHVSSVTALMSPGSNTSERQAMASKLKVAKGAGETTMSADTANSDGLPDMPVVPGTELRFTPIPTRKYPKDATPAEITHYNMDHSYVLTTLIDTVYKHVTEPVGASGESPPAPQLLILGELQFAFVCFLIGQNYDGFEQWKLLVHLLCSCEEVVMTYPDLYTCFITVLHRQLAEVPEDFFVDIVTADNFLTRTLQGFFCTLEELPGEGALGALRQKGLRFRSHLQKKYKWDFTTNPEDCAPVVVNTQTNEHTSIVTT